MNYVLVGAFVLALGTALVAGVLWLAAGGAWQTQYDTYLAVEDESVAGLNLDAPVKYNGVSVGKVQSIHLDHTNPQRVNLLFAIERGTPIKEDTIAVLKTQGLTGIAYVELNGGTAVSPLLRARPGERYPQIKTSPSLAARLENVLGNVLAKLDSTSTNLNAMLSKENQAAVRSTLADMAVVARTVAARKDSIDTTLKNTAQASAKVDAVMARVGRSADALEKMGSSVAATSESAGKTVDAVGVGLQRMSAETLPELERLLAELSALSASLKTLSEETRRDPRGLIFGRIPAAGGPGEKENKP